MVKSVVREYVNTPNRIYRVTFTLPTGQTRENICSYKTPEILEKHMQQSYIPMLAKRFKTDASAISYTYKEMSKEEYEKETTTKPH